MQTSNEFLSGETDRNLGSMIGSLTIVGQEKSNSAKIQIIGDDSHIPEDDTDDDDESPPPIEIGDKETDNTLPNNKHDRDDGQSLMEQMMAEAMKAREIEERKKKAKERKSAKKSSFGFKKGFLSSGAPKMKSSVQKKSRAEVKSTNESVDGNIERSGKIYELDSEGNMIPEKARDDIETIPKPNPSNQNPLHLKEVQEAMSDTPTGLYSTWDRFAQTPWSSPELLNRIAEHPKLVAGMKNPKFSAALEALQKDPKEAMKKFKDHADVTEFLNEFCALLGDHFTKLGEKESSKSSPRQSQPPNLQEKDVGPIAYSAIQKEKERKQKGRASWNEETMSPLEQERFDAIMKDEELTRILMDVDVQRVIQECSTIPGKMQMYMRHNVYGIKLRKLIEAGLLKVA